ncbi:MAG: DUF2786 domain-containing protein [Pseudomonadota bacterium]
MARSDQDRPDAPMRAMDALGYALDLALFTPSVLSGQTAIDRLIRSGKINAPEEKEAAASLRNSVFRLVGITGMPEKGLFEAFDLASGENIILFDQKMPPRDGARWALRTCLCDGVHISVGPVTPVDDNMMEAAQRFIDKGRGLKNPLRCAETLYRHFIRYGAPMIGIHPDMLDKEEFPFDADDGPVHSLAARWAAMDTLPNPGSGDIRLIRSESYGDPVHESLCGCTTAREMKLPRLAAAYERILVIQLETIHRRHGAGIRVTHETLESLAAEIRQGIAENTIDPSAGMLFDDLCRRAKLANSGKAANKVNRDELDKILARIQGLRGKTVERGCTEAEALLAAGKVAELLDRYGLSLNEVDMKEQSCSGEGIETSRRRRGPLDDCVGVIAIFCDCRAWYELTREGRIRNIFFGLPADVAGARCLYEKIEEAFDTETKNFKHGALYHRCDSERRRSATTSFQLGLGHGICTKLDRLKETRNASVRAAGGRDLVPIKNSVIDDELAALGLNLRAKHASRGRHVFSQAYHSGRVTGESLNWHDKIEEL